MGVCWGVLLDWSDSKAQSIGDTLGHGGARLRIIRANPTHPAIPVGVGTLAQLPLQLPTPVEPGVECRGICHLWSVWRLAVRGVRISDSQDTYYTIMDTY